MSIDLLGLPSFLQSAVISLFYSAFAESFFSDMIHEKLITEALIVYNVYTLSVTWSLNVLARITFVLFLTILPSFRNNVLQAESLTQTGQGGVWFENVFVLGFTPRFFLYICIYIYTIYIQCHTCVYNVYICGYIHSLAQISYGAIM